MTAAGGRFHRGTILIAAAAAMTFGLAMPAFATDEPKPKANIKIGSSQLEPVDWARMDGWAEDDHAAAFATFMASCKAILRAGPSARPDRPVFRGLHQACEAAAAANPKDAAAARAFFEQNFRPVRITPLGETAGFLTGYYEPIVEGSREPTEEFSHPLYRTPAGLLRGGKRLKTASFAARAKAAKAKAAAKSGKKPGKLAKAAKVTKKMARRGGRKLVSFYDRAAIEDGILKGRNLEIAYLKDPVDSFFIHIQGSARVRLAGGGTVRVNYESHNGHAYTAVGRFLIDRKIVTKEEMSMDRIRQWMTANPKEGDELRRLNKSYVFFRETGLAEDIEPVGAQGVSLTAGRSIAVDRNLHVYGMPFFIQAELPIESDQPTTRWRRLMVAQDTGGAIIGPARADIYYGAGEPAGSISGRFKQPGQFVMLFPNSVDPFAALREIPLPRPRPANIPQDDAPAKPDLVAAVAPAVTSVPMPLARPAEMKPADAKPDAKKTGEAKKPDAAKPAVKQANAKPAEAAKPAAKKPEAKKPEATAPRRKRDIEPTPPG